MSDTPLTDEVDAANAPDTNGADGWKQAYFAMMTHACIMERGNAALWKDAERYREARRNPSGYVHLLTLMVRDSANGVELDAMMDKIAESRRNAVIYAALKNRAPPSDASPGVERE